MFRNLTLFRFSPAVAEDLARLDEVLADHRLRPCGPMEMATSGFVAPVGRGDDASLTHTVNGRTWLTIGGESKLLPAAVVNDELYRKVQKISEEEGRKVGGRERKRIKEDLLNELLPRAFVRSSRLSLYLDAPGGWAVIDASSRKLAEHAISGVRMALGSFPAVPLAPEEGPRVLLTDWLGNGNLPAGLALGDECELRDPATSTGAVAISRRQDLDSEEVKEHLRNGKQVFKLGLIFDDRMSFVLGEDLVVRKLKFLDVVQDELGDSHEDAGAEADASFALMTLELARLLAKLEEWFGLPRPADEQAPRSAASPRDAVDDPVIAAARRLDDMARKQGASVTLSDGSGQVLATFGTQHAENALLARARELCVSRRIASISIIQRELRIGYNRAARLIEQLEHAGVVSVPNIQGVRTVLIE